MSTGPSAEEAIPHDTPAVASSPFVLPGDVYGADDGGRQDFDCTAARSLMDPRVKTPMADLEAQFRVSKTVYDDAMRATAALHEITVLRQQIGAAQINGGKEGSEVSQRQRAPRWS